MKERKDGFVDRGGQMVSPETARKEDEEELNQVTKVKMSVCQILALSYLVKEYLEPLIECHDKLTFERANSYQSSYYMCKKLLNTKVCKPVSCTSNHVKLFDFFSKELSNDWDRLCFENNPDREKLRCANDILFVTRNGKTTGPIGMSYI